MATTKIRNQGIRSACDRCYQLKERCDRASTTASCERCERLDQLCLTIRPVRPTGRRKARREAPVSQTISDRSINFMQALHYVGSWLSETSNLSLEEKELLILLLGDSSFLQESVISPRFRDSELESFIGPLPAAWPILKDAYLAYAGVLKSLHAGRMMDGDDRSYLRYVNSAMMALRSLPIANSNDAELCLSLGFALAFSVYAVVGVGISDICHYCLSATKPFMQTTAIDLETDSRISFLVLLETMPCFVYRQTPTLRIQSPTRDTVDRRLGLCLPLLPYYYDICVINHSLSSSDARPIGLIQQQLDKIHTEVVKWQPAPPKGFLDDFSTAEVVQLLAQAKVYRLAALLMIHRLKHPFGWEDIQADTWSREVMVELELACRISTQPVRFVTLPFIVAAVEIRDPIEREQALRNVDDYVDRFTPVVQNATKTFLSRVWHERDVYINYSWFESIHKPCVILDSIGDSLPSSLSGM